MLTLTSERDTPLHRLPAGAKLAALALGSVGIFAAPLGFAGAGLLALAVLAAGIGLFRAWARLFRPLLWVAGVILLWHGLTGTAAEGGGVVLRLLAAFGAANLVTLTTRLSEMQAVFLWLARPLAPILPPAHLALAMALVIRFVPVLALRGGQLAEAWAARSRRRLGWPLIFAITLAALDDAEHVAEALRARGGLG